MARGEIYVMKADGSQTMRLTFGAGTNLAPCWDADSTEILLTGLESQTDGDGVLEANDVAAALCLAGGRREPCGRPVVTRLVYDEMIFPWHEEP